MTRATKKLVDGVHQGILDLEDIDHDLFNCLLDSRGGIDPDIIVRTSGKFFEFWQNF